MRFSPEELYNHDCSNCALGMSANTICVEGVGNPHNHLMIIGEAPGAEEDKNGIPFIGRSGRLLDACLQEAGLPRTEAFVTNIVKCRPPGNRVPTQEEVIACMDYLYEECMAIKPKVMLLLGASALKFVLNLEGISKRRGFWQMEITDWGPCYFMPTYHPSYILRMPQKRPEFQSDLEVFIEKWRSIK